MKGDRGPSSIASKSVDWGAQWNSTGGGIGAVREFAKNYSLPILFMEVSTGSKTSMNGSHSWMQTNVP